MQCHTLIGEGRAVVCADYHINRDGSIDITEVDFEGVNILPCLLEDQLQDIELACQANEQQQAANDQYDRGQELYDERLAA